MRRLLLIAVTVMISGVWVCSQNRVPRESIRSALADLDAGRVFDAVRRLKAIPEEDPAAAAAHFYLSVIYTETGELDLASGYLDGALARQPENGVFRYQLGLIHHRNGDQRAALSSLEDAVRLGLGADEATAWRYIGDVQVLLLDRDSALEAYETAVRLGPEDARNRLALGKFYLDRNDAERAEPHLREALSLDPTLPEAHASLGLALRRLGDTASAVEVLSRGVELNPADQKARYGLAQSLMAAGRALEAQTIIEEFRRIEDSVSRANAAIEAGQRRFEDGDLTDSRQLLEEAVALAPTYGAAHQILGEVLLEADESEAAVRALERAVAINPLNARAYSSMASALRRLGRLDAALESTRKALILDDRNPGYYEQLGELLLEQGRDREALEAFAAASASEDGPAHR